ncbi:hypothetical protein ACFJIV_28810 [Mucilaginibacter sp. UC70_90]
MKRFYAGLFTLLMLLLAPGTWAQQSVWEGSKEQLLKVEDKGKKQVNKVRQWKKHIEEWGLDSNYNHALSLSGRLNTNGWSGGIYYLRQTGAGKKALWQLHFSEIKHEKEIRQERTNNLFSDLGKTTAYTFGKINNAYTLQLGYGKEQTLFPALLDGNMSVSLRYSGGLALAMLKPYYLRLIYVEYLPEQVAHIQTEKYSAVNADHFLDASNIQGGTSWSKGLGEIRYIPGLFGELAFAIEPDKPQSFVKTITIGGNIAFYSSKIEIMADRKAYPYQASFFVGLALGKRWQ